MNNKLDWLQCTRALAAIFVLIFHLTPLLKSIPSLTALEAITKWGFLGVDIFFTLSGFVVLHSFQNITTSKEAISFIRRRALRIYLGYWPALIVFGLISIYIFNGKIPAAERIFKTIFLLYPSIWDNWLPVAWSLTYEIYFYSLIFFLFFIPKNHRLKTILIFTLFIVLWNCLSVIAYQQAIFSGQKKIPFFFSGLTLEFLIGACTAITFNKIEKFFLSSYIAIPIGICLIFIGFTIGTVTPFFIDIDILRSCSFGLIGLGFLILALTFQKLELRPPRLLVAIGDASFSLYLLHAPLIDIAVLGRWNISDQNLVPYGVIWAIMTPILITLISLGWYRIIERPLQRWSTSHRRGLSIAPLTKA